MFGSWVLTVLPSVALVVAVVVVVAIGPGAAGPDVIRTPNCNAVTSMAKVIAARVIPAQMTYVEVTIAEMIAGKVTPT